MDVWEFLSKIPYLPVCHSKLAPWKLIDACSSLQLCPLPLSASTLEDGS